ncbi:staygreen family protein [Chloroflexota bacterium]
MGRLYPEKLHVTFLSDAEVDKLILPRRYTLTHSDIAGELFLSIGHDYDKGQISKLYTKLMRDEVLADLVSNKDSLQFDVYCHVSGGFVIGRAKWRYDIFRSELPLVLEAIRYGDRNIFQQNPDLDQIPVHIHFQSSNLRYNKVEQWGTMADYR